MNSKFLYKYGPLIGCAVIMVTIVPYLVWTIQTVEFFENWGCNKVSIYVLVDDMSGKYPKHSELTEAQHIKLHEIIKQCPFHGTIMEHDFENITPIEKLK